MFSMAEAVSFLAVDRDTVRDGVLDGAVVDGDLRISRSSAAAAYDARLAAARRAQRLRAEHPDHPRVVAARAAAAARVAELHR